MASDEEIKAAMIRVLKRKKRICPKTMPAHELVEAISPDFPETSIAQLAIAIFRISGRKPFRRRIIDDEIVICLEKDGS